MRSINTYIYLLHNRTKPSTKKVYLYAEFMVIEIYQKLWCNDAHNILLLEIRALYCEGLAKYLWHFSKSSWFGFSRDVNKNVPFHLTLSFSRFTSFPFIFVHLFIARKSLNLREKSLFSESLILYGDFFRRERKVGGLSEVAAA